VWNYMKRTGTARKPLAKGESLHNRIDVELQQIQMFQGLSPWQQIKKLGRNGFDRGAPIGMFDRIAARCGDIGLWIVPVGELEGFCRTIEARHGPDFTEKVLSQRDIEKDPELAEARTFVSKIWHQRA
jgi:hypothetical protein